MEGSDLFPKDNRQIELMRWLSWSSQHFTRHAGSLYFQYLISRISLRQATDPLAVEEATIWLLQASLPQVLNDHLQGRKYLLGDTLTIADSRLA